MEESKSKETAKKEETAGTKTWEFEITLAPINLVQRKLLCFTVVGKTTHE